MTRAALVDPDRELRRLDFRRVYSPGVRVAECLAGMTDVLPDVIASTAIDYLCSAQAADLLPQEADCWARLFDSLDEATWSQDLSARLAAVPPGTGSDLDCVLLGIRAGFDPEAKIELSTKAADQRGALYATGSLADLPPELALAWLARTADELQQKRRRAHDGDISHTRFEPARLYAMLLSFHDDGAGLELLLDYLEDRAVPEINKRAALGVLAHNFELVPGLREERFGRTLDILDEQAASDPPWLFGAAGAAPTAFLRATRCGREGVGRALRRLLAGDAADRSWVPFLTQLLPSDEAVGALTMLVQDPDCHVRAASASAALHRIIHDGSSGPLRELLAITVADPGCAVARALARTADGEALTPALVETLGPLSRHPAASVRRGIGRVLGTQ